MQDNNKENQEKSPQLLDLNSTDKHNLVDFFALLIKVDKRINPALYKIKIKTQKND